MGSQIVHDSSYRRAAEAYRAVDASHTGAPLVEHRIDRNGSLAGAAVSQNQLALSPADRNKCIHYPQPRLQRNRDRCTIENLGRRSFDGTALVGLHGPLVIQGPSGWIDDAPQQRVAHGHIHHSASAPDGRSGLDLIPGIQESDADPIRTLFRSPPRSAAKLLYRQVLIYSNPASEIGHSYPHPPTCSRRAFRGARASLE